MRFILISILALSTFAESTPAQEDHSNHTVASGRGSAMSVVAAPAAGRIVVDGVVDESAWSAARAVADFVQQNPREGAPSTERTEARVLYDSDALYFALRAYDRSPDSIVGRLARRDQSVQSDWLAVALDSYHDRRSAFLFAINAAGVKVDSRITDDSREDPNWDAVWDGAVTRDSLGWVAELRIPLSQLRFNRAQEGGTWGINFRRTIARREEVAFWAPIQANAGTFVSRFGDLSGLPPLGSPERVELVPYSVARLTRAPGEATNPYYSPSAWNGSFGADLKIALSSALTVNATINPDFGQVEADPSVVNLTAFETFLPERRPFFIEGAELFRSSGPQVFYSRRIGRAPQGFAPGGSLFVDMPSNATIIGAAKVTGRTKSGWSLGLLQAVTAAEKARYVTGADTESARTVEPLTSYTVARVARDFRRGQTAVGALVTATRRSLDEDHLLFLRENAYAVTLDGRHRFGGGNYELSTTVTNTLVSGDTAAIARTQRSAGHYFQRPDAKHLEYDPLAESLRGNFSQVAIGKIAGGNWRWGSSVALTTPGFEVNDLGFNGASDRLTHGFNIGYYSTTPNKTFRRWSVLTNNFGTWTSEPKLIDYMLGLELAGELHNYWGAAGFFMRHLGGLHPDILRGGPAVINPGSWMFSGNAYTDRRKKVSGSLSVHLNDETGAGGRTYVASPLLTVRPTTSFDLSVGPSFSYDLEQSQWVTTRNVGGAARYVAATVEQRSVAMSTRLNYTFAPNVSLQIYGQPFIAAGAYSGFKEVRNPGRGDFAGQFHEFTRSEISSTPTADGGQTHAIDLNADGAADYSFLDPSFNLKQLRSTSVLRWEYRPGSTVFLVWSHDRSNLHSDGTFDASRDFSRLMEGRGRNVLLLKGTYWLSF